ncbi:MAG TPA: IPT/TIG domain-containing protein [Acidimicrobiales bacterium]
MTRWLVPDRLSQLRQAHEQRELWASRRRARGASDEQGAVLILALIFLVSVSLVVVALLTWTGASLTATGAFASERATETAATSAVNLAIQNSRYPTNTSGWQAPTGLWSQMENASPPVACWPGGSTYTPPTGTQSVEVWCSMQWQPFTAQTRTITYSACVYSTGSTPPTAAACAANPNLQAIETYDDYPPGVATPAPNPVQCYVYASVTSPGGYCGQSMTQISWQWNPTVPAVTSITPTTSQITGGVAVNITGTNFVTGSTVSFVQESGNVPTNSGQSASQPTQGVLGPFSALVSGCNSSGTGCTQLSVSAPAATSGTDYFVIVTTPGGTSAYVPTSGSVDYDDLQYTPTVPTVTGISGLTESGNPCGSCPGGAITGGSNVTITGTGFYGTSVFPLIVLFCSPGAASPCTASGSTPTGTSATIESSTATSISVVSPAVSTPGVYTVQVDTLGGQSTNTSDQFGYVVQVPLIISVTDSGCTVAPCSGGHGTPVSITGANFVPGSTVTWFVDGNGSPTGGGTASSSVTVNASGSTITTTVPTLPTNNTSYFPVVTLPSADGSLASQTYNEPSDIFAYTS